MTKATASRPNPKVDWYFEQDSSWLAAFRRLRTILLATGLNEELKWGHPCYALDTKNVVLMHGFNDYCALLFNKGALMADPDGILVQQTANVQSARQVRFTSDQQVKAMSSTVTRYVNEVILVERSGEKVEFKGVAEFAVPEELKRRLDRDAALKNAFESLTPGRRKGYLLHFSSAKQAKTREARIDKCVDRIMAGEGLS